MKKSIKLLISIYIVVSLAITFNSAYAYLSTFKAAALESLDGNVIPDMDFPHLVYRNYETAHITAQKNYNSWKSQDGWLYLLGNEGSDAYYYFVSHYRKNGTMYTSDGTTYRSWGVFLHPSINTDYIKSNASIYKHWVYTSDYNDANINVYNGTTEYVSKINGETEGYFGLYDHAAIYGITGSLYSNAKSSGKIGNNAYQILKENHLWRMRVENENLYVSDNIIKSEDVENIYNLFGNQIENSQNIYISSNIYTKGGAISELDTAYKFYSKIDWGYGSPSINGGGIGKNSAINDYDNILKMPKFDDIDIYVRHIDVTGVVDINAGIIEQKAATSPVQKVGYITRNDGITLDDNWQLTNQEFFKISAYQYGDLENNYFTVNHNTSYKLINTVVGIGNNQDEAVNIRNEQYNNINTIDQLQSYRPTVDIIKNEFGKYVVIDFLYVSNTQKEKTNILVRHIDVTDMEEMSATEIYEKMNFGAVGRDIFDGYDKGINGTIQPVGRGKVKYDTFNEIYNEIYSVDNSTSYNLYNEFYGKTAEESGYNYLGAITARSDYVLDMIELTRDNKINRINIATMSPLDYSGNSYININTGSSKFIVVDMYYKQTTKTKIKFADLRGRLQYDSIDGTFTDNTSGNYDTIPSSESLYSYIYGANKYMLGGIRIVPKTITNTQTIRVNVNVPYEYSYKYWYTSTCDSGHSGTPGNTCTHVYKKTCSDGKGRKRRL